MPRIIENNTKIALYEIEGANNKSNGKIFTIERCLGTGATSVAYDGHDSNMIPYRLKNCCPEGIAPLSPEYGQFADRYKSACRQQISLLTGDTHNITSSVTGLYTDAEGSLWITTSGLAGKTYENFKDVPAETHLHILEKICEGIKAYHDAGWLMLDLKPNNILIIDSLGISGVTFFDFDSFILKTDIKTMTAGSPLMLSGTRSFSAPEVLQGDIQLVSDRSDYYSVGAILFWCLLGRKPELIDSLAGFDLSDVNLPETALREATEFLHKALNPNPMQRFDSDDEMLQAMKKIVELSDHKRLTIKNMVPKAVASFTGRGAEIAELSKKLAESMAPIFVTGEGGIGKTQLVLKAAEKLKRAGYTFYYTQFKGTIRDTILSIDTENDEEYADDDARYRAVISALACGYTSRDVLIIDNFDAAEDKNTVFLTDCEEYGDLVNLPVHVLFTTRYRFESYNILDIVSMSSDDIETAMQQIIPDASRELLADIEYAFGRNTLMSITVCKLIKAQKLKQKDINRICRRKKDLKTNIESVVKKIRLNKVEREILSVACCLPVRGVDSDVWFAILGENRYKGSFSMAECGLIQLNEYSGIWNVHSLLRDAYSKSTHIGKYLKSAENQINSADTLEITGSKRLQLIDTGKSIKQIRDYYIKTARAETMAIILLAALLSLGGVFWWSNRDTTIDPKVTLEFTRREGITDNDYSEARAAIIEKLNETTGNKCKVRDTENGFETEMKLSAVLGDQTVVHEYELEAVFASACSLEDVSEKLDSEYDISPAAYWESGNKVTGEFQVSEKNIRKEEQTVTATYINSYPEKVSEETLNSVMCTMKTRLDALKIPYSMGVSTVFENGIVISVKNERLGYAFLEALCDKYVNITIPYGSIYDSEFYSHGGLRSKSITLYSTDEHDLLCDEEGNWQFKIKLTSDYDIDDLRAATELSLKSGNEYVYLGTDSCKYLMGCKISSAISDGVLVFTSIPMYNITEIDDNWKCVLEFVNAGISADFDYYRFAADSYSDAWQGYTLKVSFKDDKEIANAISTLYPDARIYRNGDDVSCVLNPTFENDAGWISQLYSNLVYLFNSNDLLLKNVGSYQIYPFNDLEQHNMNWDGVDETWEQCFITINKNSGYIHSACFGGRFAQYKNEFMEKFSDSDFGKSIGLVFDSISEESVSDNSNYAQ